MSYEEYPKIGSRIKAVVLGFQNTPNDIRWNQIRLGSRPSQFDGTFFKHIDISNRKEHPSYL